MANTKKAKSCSNCSYEVCLAKISRAGYACEDYKRKPKYVKVKARMVVDKNGEIWASPWNMPDDGYPCTILIDSKYLKGGKVI